MLKNKINYTTINGAKYPDLQISKNPNADKIPVGRYGQMYLNYLKNKHPERYVELKMSGELMPLVHKANDETYKQIRDLTDRLMKQYPSTTDTIQKFKQHNHCQAIAEEIMLKEFLYKVR